MNPRSAWRVSPSRRRLLLLLGLLIALLGWGFSSGYLPTLIIPNYRHSLRVSKEAVLRANLETLRRTIQNYTLDKQAAPNSLEDLVGAGYLREVPKDITGTSTSWQLEYCEEFLSPEQSDSGLCDVKSGSTQLSTDGAPYNTW